MHMMPPGGGGAAARPGACDDGTAAGWLSGACELAPCMRAASLQTFTRPWAPLASTNPDPSAVQAVKAGWALEFKSSELVPETAHRLAATIQRVSSDAAFAQKAASVRAMLRAHPRLPVEQAAGEPCGIQPWVGQVDGAHGRLVGVPSTVRLRPLETCLL